MSRATRNQALHLVGALAIVLLLPAVLAAQWSAQPGETLCNAFGPPRGERTKQCRGACGVDCPSTCTESIRYECLDSGGLLRVETYECRTHQGCREHDDCLDRCSQQNVKGVDCQARCHLEAVENYGFEDATSWATGGGPHDGDAIIFEYTRELPTAPEPTYRCTEGTRPECSGDDGRCLTASGFLEEPIFDSFPQHGADGLRISGFRSGRLCDRQSTHRKICEETVDIHLTGRDSCEQRGAETRCTRYGFELDHVNADPTVPLICSWTSSSGQGDFLGDVAAAGLGAIPTQQGGSELEAALGHIQEALSSSGSLTEALPGISITPMGEDGQPVESARVGGQQRPAGPPPTPTRVELGAADGHLVVPMYALHDPSRPREVEVRDVKCSYRGAPVIETTFRLHPVGN